MRGRDSETRLINETLQRGRNGTGGVVLVEGEPGMGKSLLLAEAEKAATALGYTTVTAVADEFERMIPLCPLLLALGDVTEPAPPAGPQPAPPADFADSAESAEPQPAEPEPADFADSADVEDFAGFADPDPRMRGVARVRRALERLARQGPVLVSVDDVQHADPVTLLALRVLPRQLAVRPLSWILARSTQTPAQASNQTSTQLLTRTSIGPQTGAARLFDLLDHDGAERVRLLPLPEAAIGDVITDLLGVAPDRSLMTLADGAAGNPLLLGELLRGLREENMLATSSSGATVAAERLPDRVHGFFRHQLAGLRPQTRQLIEVSAVLGRSFAVEDAAEMLGQSPAMTLPAVTEALAAGILVPAQDALAFRDGMTWRAIAEATPDSLSRALHHQAGQLLLDRGDAAQAAEHLVAGARWGDRRVLRELDLATRKVLPASARTAVGLATRALELTLPEDPERAERFVTAVHALLAAGRLRAAGKLIDSALAGPIPAMPGMPGIRGVPLTPLPRARLRCARASILTLSGRPVRARAEAEELLADPDLPARVRDDVTVALLQALGELPDLAAAEQRARGVVRHAARLRGPDRPTGSVLAAAKGLQATVKWNQGHIAASLDLFRDAVSEVPPEPAGVRRPYPLFLPLAARLIDVRLVDEASDLISAPCADGDWASLALAQSVPALLRARMHLAAGRIEPAVSEAEAALGTDQAGDDSPHTILARCMLGIIALRRGDLGSASQMLGWVRPRLAEAGSGRAGVLCRVLAAQVADALDGPAAAMGIAGGVYDKIGEVRWPLISDPGMPPWLVRTALAAGDRKRAVRVAGAAAELRRLNPAFPVVTAACAHAQGLVKADADLVELAARTQPDTWARATAAADLAALLADAHRVGEAVGWLDRAHDDFLTSGASRDAARVRGMLRGLGVRKRRWRAPERPPAPGRFAPRRPAASERPASERPASERPASERPATAGPRAAVLDTLTGAERDIADLVSQGLTNRQVAERTFVSVNTVAFHLRNIYRKLRVASRVQLTRLILDATPSAASTPPPVPLRREPRASPLQTP